MLDVFLSVDVEIWCNGWSDLDAKFDAAFQQYVYGTTPRGDFGLPYQLKLLEEHGLAGVFFVEPLFSRRFGSRPLEEIVRLLRDGGQEVQLHLHTEWVDEAREPLLPDVGAKRQHLRYFDLAEQTVLIGAGARLLAQAGAGEVNAFRAGSFAFNRDTLRALAANGIAFDSSYNYSCFGQDSGVMPGEALLDAAECDGVHEYPVTVFRDGAGSLRHAQLTACSYAELETLLWQALHERRSAFVMLLHNFELLNLAKDAPDDIVVKRFRRLCAFLDRNRDCFRTRGFRGLQAQAVARQPGLLEVPIWKTAGRMVEQIYRRKYG